MSLLAREYIAVLGARRSRLLLGLFGLGLVLTPITLQHPPPELVAFLGRWLGPERTADKLLLFAWCDLAMNKLTVIAALALGGGLLITERATGLLPLLLSKPLTPGRLYTIKLLAAQGVFLTLYALFNGLALVIYPWLLPHFHRGDFALVALVHGLASCCAVGLAGWLGLLFRQRLAGLMAAVLVLSLLIGTAFGGVYAPALAGLSGLNPFYHPLVLIIGLERVDAGAVLGRIGWLLALNGLALGLGVWQIHRLTRREALL